MPNQWRKSPYVVRLNSRRLSTGPSKAKRQAYYDGLTKPLTEAIILALFSNNEQGAYYDPYDLTDEKLAWRRNLLLWSEDFSNSAWTAVGNGVGIGNTIRAGNGSFSRVHQEVFIDNSSTIVSAIIYPGTSNLVRFTMRNLVAGADDRFNVDLTTGSISSTSFPSNLVHSIVVNPVDGGVFVSFNINPQGLSSIQLGLGCPDADSLSTIIVTELQIEKGLVPTPYQRITDFTSDFMTAFPNHTFFQDSLGTIPVTGHMQPLGLVLDKSGRNNHASQPNSAFRPLWQNNGGLKSFWFDGIDDHLLTVNTMDFSGTSEVSVFAGVRKVSSTLGAILHIDNGVSSTTSANQIELFAPFTSEGTFNGRLSSASGVPIDAIATGFSEPSSDVLYQTVNSLLARSTLQVNSNTTITALGSGSNPEVRSGQIVIGARNLQSLTSFYQGHIYNLIIRSTLTEETQAEPIRQLLATRSGVTL